MCNSKRDITDLEFLLTNCKIKGKMCVMLAGITSAYTWRLHKIKRWNKGKGSMSLEQGPLVCLSPL